MVKLGPTRNGIIALEQFPAAWVQTDSVVFDSERGVLGICGAVPEYTGNPRLLPSPAVSTIIDLRGPATVLSSAATAAVCWFMLHQRPVKFLSAVGPGSAGLRPPAA